MSKPNKFTQFTTKTLVDWLMDCIKVYQQYFSHITTAESPEGTWRFSLMHILTFRGNGFKSKLEKCKVITVRIHVFRSNFSVMNLLGSISVREFQTPKKSDLFQSHLNSIGYIQVFTDLVISRVPCSYSFVLNQSHMPLYPIPLYPNIYKNIIR